VRPSILLVHGALGSARQLAPLADALRASLATVVRVVELPGHGETPGDDTEFQMDAFAARLAANAQAVQGADEPPPVVFGYSMGGYAALLAEATHPGTFGGVVTYGTMFEWTPEVAAGAAARLDPVIMADKVPAFAAQLRERHALAGGWETMLRRTAALLHALGASPPLTAATLREVGCPVTLLVGERDDTVTLASTTAVASQLPHGAVSVVPRAPHPIEKVPVSAIVLALTELLLPRA
jgi:pimeloyl-ACP methyl ester carboxylesterase